MSRMINRKIEDFKVKVDVLDNQLVTKTARKVPN